MLGAAVAITAARWDPARAQSLIDLSSLPSVGTVVRPGDLRDHLSGTSPVQGLVGGGRAFTINTALDLQELATDNAFNSPVAKSADFITTIRPSLSVAAETARFQGNFTYAPSANLYARNSSQSYVSQNLSGTGLATLVPDLFFLRLNAFAAVQATQGGFGPSTTTTLNRQNQTQTTSFSASPYLTHKFGGTGTLEAGATISYSGNNNVTPISSGNVIPSAQLGLLTPNTRTVPNSNYTSTEEHASFATGEDFGRLSHRIAVSATQYSGQGVYQGAYRSLQTYDIGYAISRFVTALAEIGHESIHYGGVPPVRIDDLVWDVGAKVAPNGNSALTLTYGHHDGGDALTFDGHYQATARLQLYARYTDSLTTSAESIADALASVDTTTSGALFDTANGAPINITDSFFGIQSGLYRLRRMSATASLFYSRDLFSFNVSRQSQQVISSASATSTGTSNRGTYGSIAWTHDLSPDVQSNAFIQYGTYSTSASNAGAASSGNVSVVVSLALSYTLSSSLRINAQYSFSKNDSNTPGQSSTQNAFLVGVHKQF
jgi:uncharacterized protein (PEP-CTERM system associated)